MKAPSEEKYDESTQGTLKKYIQWVKFSTFSGGGTARPPSWLRP